ncbi:MAG: hypothetical protein GXN93_03745 [Candidatus Diapherotrites archaeon]|nr:hypothetical protein [Candidatus Diapherotrites archaeon]
MDRKERMILGVVMIFMLGLATRIYLEKYTYIFGFDSYWFARMASYIVQYGHLPKYDPLAFRGFPPEPLDWELSMDFPAWTYKLVYGTQYLQSNMLMVFKWLPASFGALGSAIMMGLGYVLGGPILGTLTGFFAATNPGYIYRTLSGFYEDDATSFFIPLALIFAFLAYKAKDRKKYWLYLAIASLIMLIQAISWDGFFIVPYSVVAFTIIYAGYVVARYVSRYIPDENRDWIILGAAAVLSIIGWFFVHNIAMAEAGEALAMTGSLTATTIYTLATPVLSVIMYAIAAAAVVLWLKSNNLKYLYIAMISFVFAIALYLGPVNSGFSTEITDATGVAHRIGFQSTSFSMMFLGSAFMILVASLAGISAAFMYDKPKKDEKIIDWRLLGVVYIPLLVAALSGPINGFDWYKPVITFAAKILPLEADKGVAADQVLHPHWGLIEPKTAGPWSAVIGEETYGFANWPAKYGILAVIVLLSIPFVAYRATKDRRFLYILGWLALTWWAAWYQLKFCYYLGLPIAIASAVALEDVFQRVKTNKAKAAIIAVIGLIAMSMVATATYHTATRIPMLLTNKEYQEMNLAPKGLPLFSAQPGEDYIAMFKWIDANTPKDANLLNWWSIGHWLTFFTNRGVMTDNTNYYYQADVEAAQFFLAPDENTAYGIAEKRHMNYVIFQPAFLWQGYALGLYALQTQDLRDPRLADFSAGTITCQKVSKSVVTGKPYYICLEHGSVLTTLSTEQWAEIPPFTAQTWHEFNAATRLKIGDREYAVYKVSEDSNGGQLILLAKGMNDSMIVKMLLNVPMKHFKRVWVAPQGSLMIYKIE